MAASMSRPDPTLPSSVAEASFSTTRRGFNQDEVRALLSSVAGELSRLQERERQLEAVLRDERAAAAQPVELDDETVTNLLGEETLRVLQTARESASQIKIRAEESAARVVREANDEANRLRQDVEVESARRRQDAASDAEAEVALAKQQGREMVNEARAYRERVLADLERRTTLARQQIEELAHGRDRLLQVFERARLVAVDVTSELRDIDEPSEYVSLAPTTGPVPLMVPNSKPPFDDTDIDIDDTDVDDDLDMSDTGIDDAGTADIADQGDQGDADDDLVVDGAADDDVEAAAALDDDDVELVDIVDDAISDHDDEAEADDSDDAPSGRASSSGNVVSLFRTPTAAEADDADDVADDDRPDVGGIFARLRDEVPAEPAVVTESSDDDAASDVEPDTDTDDEVAVEPTPFSRRDEAIVPLIVSAARKLKRVLADEQNGVLDTLRQNAPVTALDALIDDDDEHVAAYVTVITDELLAAAAAGAGELGANDTKTLRRTLDKVGAVDAAVAFVRTNLVTPLRDRLDRSVSEGSGDNDDITKRVRAVYREWKTQHIDDQLDDVFRFAYGGGLSASADPGRAMVWVIDPTEPACPDCEDNSLAGPVASGDQYPTGHSSAPAHAGCRCLTVPAPQ